MNRNLFFLIILSFLLYEGCSQPVAQAPDKSLDIHAPFGLDWEQNTSEREAINVAFSEGCTESDLTRRTHSGNFNELLSAMVVCSDPAKRRFKVPSESLPTEMRTGRANFYFDAEGNPSRLHYYYFGDIENDGSSGEVIALYEDLSKLIILQVGHPALTETVEFDPPLQRSNIDGVKPCQVWQEALYAITLCQRKWPPGGSADTLIVDLYISRLDRVAHGVELLLSIDPNATGDPLFSGVFANLLSLKREADNQHEIEKSELAERFQAGLVVNRDISAYGDCNDPGLRTLETIVSAGRERSFSIEFTEYVGDLTGDDLAVAAQSYYNSNIFSLGTKDVEEITLFWEYKAYTQGSSIAALQLADASLYCRGHVKQDFDNGLKYLEFAVKSGNPRATLLYSLLAMSGVVEDISISSGFEMLKACADSGFDRCVVLFREAKAHREVFADLYQ